MGERLRIIQHVNYYDEAFLLLYFWVNKDDMEEVRVRYAAYFSSDMENYNHKFDIMLDIYNCVKNRLNDKIERIKYYFKDQNSDFSTFASLAVLWDYHKYDNTLQSYAKRLDSISEEQRVKEFAKLIDCEGMVNTPSDNLKTMEDLITFIESSPYTAQAKWEAIKIYNNQEVYYNEVTEILKQTMDILKNDFDDRIEDLERSFTGYWNEYQKTGDIIDDMKEKLGISWEPSNAGILLMPMIFQPISISLSVDEDDRDSMDILRIGIMIDRRFILASKKLNKEDIVNIGKLLCDMSKVDILEMTGKRPCYGKEIANGLKLSTATISYHVNALLKIGFLKAEVKSNKVYYSMNRERISEYLDEVKKYFTEL